MTYTLGQDLANANGTIIYPKGYSFNPLDYISFQGGIVVIDGSDPQHIEWFLASPYANDPRVRLLLSDGYAFQISQQLDSPVYFLTGDIAERFGLSVVPSIVVQKGKLVEVHELLIASQQTPEAAGAMRSINEI